MGWSIDEIKEAMENFMKQKVPVSYPASRADFVPTRILFPLTVKT